MLSFGTGIFIAKRTAIPIAQRRKLYGKAVLGGTYSLLAIHGILVAATLPTRVFEPLTQLWFGMRFAQFALPILPVFMLVPILMLPIMKPVEKRLFGPSSPPPVVTI